MSMRNITSTSHRHKDIDIDLDIFFWWRSHQQLV